jgi:hypothetical protein
MNVVARIPREAFNNKSQLCCTGKQVERVILLVENCCGPVDWYVADLFPTIAEVKEYKNSFQIAGSTAVVASQVATIRQFESGVFTAVSACNPSHDLRSEVYTDDDVQSKLGCSLIELRLFDFSYIELISGDSKLLEKILRTGFTGEISIVSE